METAEIVDSIGPFGLNANALIEAVEEQGSPSKALRYYADLIATGDGGVDHEDCIVPDLRAFASWLEEGFVNEKAFWAMFASEP